MTRLNALQRIGTAALVLGVVAASSRQKCDARPAPQNQNQQSQSQQSQQATPAPAVAPATQTWQERRVDAPTDSKGRKLWNNNDVIALRTPADIYILEKEAREAAEAEAAAKEAALQAAAKSALPSAPAMQLPATQEDTEKALKDKQADLEEESAAVEKLKSEVPDMPAEQQPDKQKEMDRLSADIEGLKRDIKLLQDHLQTFTPKPETQNPLPAAPPSPNL